MNKTELIEALAPRLGGRTQAAAAVEAVVDLVLREVAAGRSVGITGFGTFEKVDRAPRTGRNPRTGEPVPIAGTSTPRFRPGAYFKDVVADPSALPPQGLAGARVGSDGRLERTGAPSSVRRADGSPSGRTATEDTPQKPDRHGGRGEARDGGRGKDQNPGPDTGRKGGRASQVSGTPESVRKDTDPAPKVDPGLSGSGRAGAASGRIMGGGEDITQGMIWAKKAQLAQVKNDELAAQQEKQAKKARKAEAGDQAAKGKAANGKAAKGKAANGKAAKGKAANGKAAKGKAAKGKAAKGKAANGKAAKSAAPTKRKKSQKSG